MDLSYHYYIELYLGIGLMILLDHNVGTWPVWKQTLNRLWSRSTDESFFNTSEGIQSPPEALPSLAFWTALTTSRMLIFWSSELSTKSRVSIQSHLFVLSEFKRLQKSVFHLLRTVLTLSETVPSSRITCIEMNFLQSDTIPILPIFLQNSFWSLFRFDKIFSCTLYH